MNAFRFLILLSWGIILAGSCKHEPPKYNHNDDGKHELKIQKSFQLPALPITLTEPEERAAYLSLHYWDHFDFLDTTLISLPDVSEQAFVDFIGVLPHASNIQAAIDTLFIRASVNKSMFKYFAALADKYLYEPNSPMCNEDLYVAVLKSWVNGIMLDETEKIRPRFRLEMALKNRPGDKAADFYFIDRKGKKKRLWTIQAPLLILYFNDPACEECAGVKQQLIRSLIINDKLHANNVELLSVCVEGKTPAWEQLVLPEHWLDGYDDRQTLTRDKVYDLKAMPTLYLLDKSKRVILKDTSVKQIENWLRDRNNTK